MNASPNPNFDPHDEFLASLPPSAPTPALYADVPTKLKTLNNWVVWKLETRDGNLTKPLYDAKQNGKHVYAKTNDATTWAPFARATELTDGGDYEGIGFVFTGTDYVGIDLDGVVHDDSTIDPFATEIVKLANSYCEFSPSGTGVHVIFESSLPLPKGNRKGNKKLGGEIYNKTSPRYFTITGNKVDGLSTDIANIDDPDKIGLLHFMVLHLHDTRLTTLWMGDPSLWGPDAKYPSQSEADQALCNLLARRLNYDAQKIEKYFGASILGQREKWTDRPDYRERTIAKALGGKNSQQEYSESGNSPPANAERMNLLSLAEVEEEMQRWLWDSRIPLGALTNLSGVADKGKSLVLYDVCARISNGSHFPDGAKNPFQGKPKKVLLLFSEGSLKTTVKPRMMVMGANMANVLTVKSVSRKGETDPDKRQFYLDQDLGSLRQVLRENPDIVLIGFDPLTNYLGDNCNMNLSRDVRKVLTPLGELAEEFGVTVVAIIHFNKNDATNAIYRTGGASALIEVPRAAWCCVDDDDPNRKGGFIFVRIKNNLGKRVGGICYRIEETFISIKGEQASQPRLIWGDASDKTADDLLNLSQHKDEDEHGVVQAMHWLENIFKDNFARRSAAVHQLAETEGITEDCLKKARLKLQMQTKKISDRWLMRRHQNKDLPWTVSTDVQQRLEAMETRTRAEEPAMAEVVAEGANSAEEVF